LKTNIPAENCLLVFAREPVLGQVKTRLAGTLGQEMAYRAYVLLLQYTLDLLPPAGFSKVLLATPDSSLATARAWAPGLDAYWPQGEGDLGNRLERAFAAAFKSGFRKVLAIGTDCPELNPGDLQAALIGLDSTDTVLGPARDGGYYLIGLKSPAPELFREIPWGSGQVYPKTTAILNSQRKTYLSLRLLSDVDTQEDWEKLRNREPLNQLGI
jgi:rSAM/selenodomain-associated transferase 1